MLPLKDLKWMKSRLEVHKWTIESCNRNPNVSANLFTDNSLHFPDNHCSPLSPSARRVLEKPEHSAGTFPELVVFAEFKHQQKRPVFLRAVLFFLCHKFAMIRLYSSIWWRKYGFLSKSLIVRLLSRVLCT